MLIEQEEAAGIDRPSERIMFKSVATCQVPELLSTKRFPLYLALGCFSFLCGNLSSCDIIYSIPWSRPAWAWMTP